MTYKIIQSSSKGNAVLYHNEILVDCGVAYKQVAPYVQDIKLILLTHTHRDHLNLSTLKKIVKLNPSVRIACCEWLLEKLDTLKDFDNLDILELNVLYQTGPYQISPFYLYHDIPNCGWRIIKNDYKIIHATDTHTLEGITAEGYDLFAIEGNYDEELAQKAIETSKETGEYTRVYQSIDSHLSYQQRSGFIETNRKESSESITLHESSTFGYGF